MKNLNEFVVEERNQVRKNVKITSVLCAILIVVVAVEVIYIRSSLHKHVTAENISVMVMDSIYTQLPELHEQMIIGSYKTAPSVANEVVNYSLGVMQSIGPMSIERTLLLTDEVMAGLRTHGTPIFEDFLLTIYGNVDANKEQLKNPAYVSQQVDGLLDEWEMQVQNEIEDGLLVTIINLNGQVSQLLSTPQEELTKQQKAQKRMLVCSKIMMDRLD